MTTPTIERAAVEFLQGWVSGYMAHGGSLADDGLAEKAAAAYERRLHPPDLPEPVQIQLQDAIDAVKAAEEQRAEDVDWEECPCGCDMPMSHPDYAVRHGDTQ